MLRVVDKGASRRLNCELLVPGVSESAAAADEGVPSLHEPERAAERQMTALVTVWRRWFRRSRNNLKQQHCVQGDRGTLSKIDLSPLNYAIMASIIMLSWS